MLGEQNERRQEQLRTQRQKGPGRPDLVSKRAMASHMNCHKMRCAACDLAQVTEQNQCNLSQKCKDF
jgi:hypothetical protein